MGLTAALLGDVNDEKWGGYTAPRKTMNYSINKDAIIFLDVDKENNYRTIAYDYKSDDVVAIRPLEYRLLKYVYENQPVSENKLFDFLGGDADVGELAELVTKLISKNILRKADE